MSPAPYLSLMGELWGVYCEGLGEIDCIIMARHCIYFMAIYWFTVPLVSSSLTCWIVGGKACACICIWFCLPTWFDRLLITSIKIAPDDKRNIKRTYIHIFPKTILGMSSEVMSDMNLTYKKMFAFHVLKFLQLSSQTVWYHLKPLDDILNGRFALEKRNAYIFLKLTLFDWCRIRTHADMIRHQSLTGCLPDVGFEPLLTW